MKQQKLDFPKFNPKTVGIYTLAIAAGVALDQVTKAWAYARLRGQSPVEVIQGLLAFQYVENRNAAFGFLSSLPEDYKRNILLVMTLGLTAVLIIAMIRSTHPATRLGLGVIAAGAIGNIFDRVVRHAVVDFIWFHGDFSFDASILWAKGGFSWPNFNVADILVCTGVGIIIVFGGKKKAPPAPAKV